MSDEPKKPTTRVEVVVAGPMAVRLTITSEGGSLSLDITPESALQLARKFNAAANVAIAWPTEPGS